MPQTNVKKQLVFPAYRTQESKSSLTRIDIANAVRPVLAMYPRLASPPAGQQGLAEVCSSRRRQRRSARYSALHNTLLAKPTLRVRVVDKVSSSHWVHP